MSIVYQPVAARAKSSIRAQDEVSGLDQGMTEVGVGLVPGALKELIVSRRSSPVAASSAK